MTKTQVMAKLILSFSIFLFLVSCSDSNKDFIPQFGQTINKSLFLKKDTFKINANDSLNQPLLLIEGENLVIDFNDAVLKGSNDKQAPNEFYGLAILIKNSKNITLKNANIHGFKVAVLAENTDSLKIENCNFSYNYRQKLKSIREREDLSDWLYYHHNDNDEWLRYGMGIYLKNCDNALVKDVHITGGQNGLMMTECDNGLFYNNEINFNSGIGIGLYRSSRNQIMHNKLDWNVRGYSHGFYSRGQDSAGILVYEQSNENTFAYNSATHSGDGFFLWAGQTTMDNGTGGCNNNLIYGNDFSYAPTNGIEVTFSSNKIFSNTLKDCRYGIWGGYSWDTEIGQNRIENCDYGIAIEHGQNNKLHWNFFRNDSVGIKIWERENQPVDWRYSKEKDVSSKDYSVFENIFTDVQKPLVINSSSNLNVEKNTFHEYNELIHDKQPNTNLIFGNNLIHGNSAKKYISKNKFTREESSLIKAEKRLFSQPIFNQPDQIPDGQNVKLSSSQLNGRQYILVNEWGPYNFKYPVIWLREINRNKYTFLLLGPQGNWKCIGGKGLKRFGPKTGTFPATIIAEKDPGSDEIALDLEFIGEEITDQFGKRYKRGTVFPFSFSRFQKNMEWQVKWYEFDESTDPLKNYEAFKNLNNNPPQKITTTSNLVYSWRGSPGNNINPDQFGTFAKTAVEIKPGKYKISISSDDGLKFYLDGKLVIDHWDIHVPSTDKIEVELGGKHTFEIEHFEGGGYSTLSFLLQKM